LSVDWTVERGSVLDAPYLESLGSFDVVYSWGVLHHTGDMWRAIDLLSKRVSPTGLFFIAIYNDQGRASLWWTVIKRAYCSSPSVLKAAILAACFIRIWGPTFVKDSLRGNPLRSWRNYASGGRGMSAWTDVVDWVGGYPFEVASSEAVSDYLGERGFVLKKIQTVGTGSGCNEFVFQKT
jgi:2-polyprenyl-6-hydroxyphenyl methylase/3-demethylubiquinone-9 3-methyltransferase